MLGGSPIAVFANHLALPKQDKEPPWWPADGRSPEKSSKDSTGQQPPSRSPGALQGLAARPWRWASSELLGQLPPGRLLRGLHGLLHVDDELRGLPALRVHGHRLDALHVVRGHDQVVLLGQLHGCLLQRLLDHDRVVGAGLLVGDLGRQERSRHAGLLLGRAMTTVTHCYGALGCPRARAHRTQASPRLHSLPGTGAA